MGLGRKTTEVECHFPHILSGRLRSDLSLLVLTWLRLCLSEFSTVKLVFFPPLCILCSLEGRHCVQPPLKDWAFVPHLQEKAA